MAAPHPLLPLPASLPASGTRRSQHPRVHLDRPRRVRPASEPAIVSESATAIRSRSAGSPSTRVQRRRERRRVRRRHHRAGSITSSGRPPASLTTSGRPNGSARVATPDCASKWVYGSTTTSAATKYVSHRAVGTYSSTQSHAAPTPSSSISAAYGAQSPHGWPAIYEHRVRVIAARPPRTPATGPRRPCMGGCCRSRA